MPTNDTLIFQHIHSSSDCLKWVALTAPITLEYCLAHKMDYQLVARDLGDLSPKGEWGHWIVPQLVREFFDLGYENIIYLDADTIIADSTVDLRDACKPDMIGAVQHNLKYHNPDWSHFNVGALYISTTAKVRNFVDMWLAGYPGTRAFPWLDQGVFGRIGAEMGIINHLDNRWNAGHVSPSDNPIVLGLHGFPDRYEAMKREVEKIRK